MEAQTPTETGKIDPHTPIEIGKMDVQTPTETEKMDAQAPTETGKVDAQEQIPQKEEDGKPNEKTLWKLFKGKTVLIYHLCTGCHKRLYFSTDKIQESGEHWVIKFELCKECVIKNCKATTALTKPYMRLVKEDK